MYKLAFHNAKGGVGKTTLAISVGAELARRGLKVLLVDGDRPQWLAQDWWKTRQSLVASDDPKRARATPLPNLAVTRLELGMQIHRSVDWVVFDLSGRLDDTDQIDQEVRYVYAVADLIVCPMRMSKFDVSQLRRVTDAVEKLRKAGRYPSVAVLANFLKRNVPSMLRDVEDLREHQHPPFVRVLKTGIRDLKGWNDALTDGLIPTEMDSSEAGADLGVLVSELQKIEKGRK